MRLTILATLLVLAACSGGGKKDNNNPPVPTPDKFGCQTLVDTPPRGLSTMHCNLDGARGQCEKLISILGHSCLKRPALSYLVDGTFGFNLNHMNHDILTLATGGREPNVLFYLTSGPTQRRYKSQTYGGYGTRISPEEFRRKIQHDGSFQAGYVNLLRRLTPLLSTLQALGGKPFVVLMLEDNLDDTSATKMHQLLMPHAPPGSRLGRNPCPGAYPGNGASIPTGLFKEDHACQGSSVTNGVVTNDGKTYLLTGQQSSYTKCDMLNIKRLRDGSAGQNNMFLFWSAPFQGLTSSSLPPPNQRNYTVPNVAQEAELINLLRGQ